MPGHDACCLWCWLLWQRYLTHKFAAGTQAHQKDIVGTGNVTFTAGWKGQTVVAMVAAYAYNAFPLIYDLTGKTDTSRHQPN